MQRVATEHSGEFRMQGTIRCSGSGALFQMPPLRWRSNAARSAAPRATVWRYWLSACPEDARDVSLGSSRDTPTTSPARRLNLSNRTSPRNRDHLGVIVILLRLRQARADRAAHDSPSLGFHFSAANSTSASPQSKSTSASTKRRPSGRSRTMRQGTHPRSRRGPRKRTVPRLPHTRRPTKAAPRQASRRRLGIRSGGPPRIRRRPHRNHKERTPP
jgi:hypothetical protein